PDLGPGVENPADLGTHGGGRVPAHRITEVDARDGNARGGPLVDLQLQDLHAAVLADLTGPVRSPARVDGDLGLLRTAFDGAGDDTVERVDLVLHRACGVALDEDVVEVDLGLPDARIRRGDLRSERRAPFDTLLVECQGGVAHSLDRGETLDDLLDLRHLRHPLG